MKNVHKGQLKSNASFFWKIIQLKVTTK